MLWGSDLDGVAMLAKEQHANMLADARRRQQLRQLLGGRDHTRNAWQWPRRLFSAQRSQESRLEPPSMSRSVLRG